MKIVILILASILATSFTTGDFTPNGTVNEKHSGFTTDHLGNLYLINQVSIIKYSQDGKKLSEYANNILGDISYADVSDPLRILLYYKDFNKVVLLNNALSEINSIIDLNDIENINSGIACTSTKGGFWVYDEVDFKIKYINKSLNVEFESGYINDLLTDESAPDFFVEKNEFVYLHFPGTGLLMFDRFGAYYKTIIIPETNNIQVINKNIIYFSNNKIYSYYPQLLKTDSIEIPLGECSSARMEKGLLFLEKNNEISIFKGKTF